MTDLAQIYASLGLGNPTATANDLSSFQNNVLASDPWNIAAKSLGSAQFDTRTWTPTEQVVAPFAKNFLAGILGQYARNDAADQLNKVVQVMPQLRSDPLNVALPEGVDESAFSTLRSNQVLKNLETKAQQEASLQEALQKVGIAGLTKKSEILGENSAYSALGDVALQNPSSPQYKANQDKIDSERALDSKVTDARDFLEKSKIGVTYSEVKPLITQITNNLDKTGKAADLAVFTALAKSIDPVGAISDQTIKTTQDAIPYLERAFGSTAGFFTGEGLLKKESKIKILEQVASKVNSLGAEYSGLIKGEKERLKILGANPDLLTTLDVTPFDISAYQTVQITNPKNGKVYNIPANDPRLKELQRGSTPYG